MPSDMVTGTLDYNYDGMAAERDTYLESLAREMGLSLDRSH